MPRCLSKGVDIFLKSVKRQGESGHDVRVSQAMCAWLLAHMDGACRRPRHNENHLSLFIRKFTPGDATSRRDVPFAVGVRGVYDSPTLRAMHSIHKCVANTLKTMNSVQKNSQIRNFCTEFLHFTRSAKITAFCMAKSHIFVFFL